MQLAKANTSYQTYLLQPAHGRKPIHGVRFSQTLLASVGFDGSIHFWSAFGDFPNVAVLHLSKRPLLQVDYYNKSRACAVASADGRVYLVDADEKFTLIRALEGHFSYVNGVCGYGENSVISSSDDRTVKIWDAREGSESSTIDLKYEATSVAWSEYQPTQIFCGSLDSNIYSYDSRKPTTPLFVLKFHKDVVTGLSVSPDGRELLSSALDGTLAIWDCAPFSPRNERLISCVPHGAPAADSISDRALLRCSWTPDGLKFAAGSGSMSEFVVCMWDKKGQPQKAFPGHAGFVPEVAFHPTDSIMASCGMDGRLFVGGYT